METVACRLDAVAQLAKTRGARIGDDPVVTLTLSWTEHGRSRSRALTLGLLSTAQPFGGARWWWQCPACRRRCRFLLVPNPTGPIGCRRCLHAHYVTDYPSRAASRRLAQLLTGVLKGGIEDAIDTRVLDALLVKKRRGVRRGRRVQQRAVRELAKLPGRLSAAIVSLEAYQG